MEFEDLKIEVPLDSDFSYLFNVPVKKYENKDRGCFITGFDVVSEEAEEKRMKRAKRFGLHEKDNKDLSVTEALPSFLEILPTVNDDAKLRPDAILLFGVNEMSTKDVFDYFKDYVPNSIEWIDDISCVVIWDDDNSAKRALMNVGKYFISQNNKATGHDENVWRIGIQHPKAKQLLMRVATTADKKIKGASSRSMYYLIHGQPKKNKRVKKRGLITSSRQRKINAELMHIKKELHEGPNVEIVEENLYNPTETFEEEMDLDEPSIKVLISEDVFQKRQAPEGNLYSDKHQLTNVKSRLKSTADYPLDPAKMDHVDPVNSISDLPDLRHKLGKRKKKFNVF
ncbi:nuclear cap-binding protein subunit 3-like [Xenia sp. Carnegie-2017]|uniref:nuclear cap-binding protein subunit 3-like n=1 Tax=Xenia sp. Carnegie-2017 TaxID=2897299 RepID=UPI001F047109|nr:nuclear cap-binding protein subunit 3-like [Xenia sp. Carnegie-2017]